MQHLLFKSQLKKKKWVIEEASFLPLAVVVNYQAEPAASRFSAEVTIFGLIHIRSVRCLIVDAKGIPHGFVLSSSGRPDFFID